MILEDPFQPKPSFYLQQALASEQEEVAVQGLVFTHALLDREARTCAMASPDPPGAAVLPSSGRCCSYGIFLKGESIFAFHRSPVTSTFKNKQRLQHSPARDV